MKPTIRYRQKSTGAPLSSQPSPEELLDYLYRLRGCEGKESYNLSNLPDPQLFKDMDRAVSLIIQHIKAQQPIMIVGDYDADGATSTTLLLRGLAAMGARQLDFIVPSRHTHGYGLSPALVNIIHTEREAQLIITVDNGISANAGVSAAQSLGYDVIITDHHLPADTLPNANAILNPNQPDCSFPDKNLAGVGVAFYLLIGLRQRVTQDPWFAEQQISAPNLAQWLDLVAIGTICDVVKLTPLNRLLIDQGLRRIRSDRCLAGINALLSVSKKPRALLSSTDIAFGIGPKINAAGRLDDMTIGINCLNAPDEQSALIHVNALSSLNHSRQSLQAETLEEALEMVDDQIDLTRKKCICLYQPHWHSGIVGLIAGRLKEQFHRPCIVFGADENGMLKGSGRSVPGCHMRDFLDWVDKQHVGVIERFGGHAMAAGLSIREDQYTAFTQALDQACQEWLADFSPIKEHWSDGYLPPDALTLNHASVLRTQAPWGNGFDAPCFIGSFEVIKADIVGGLHYKFSLKPIVTNEQPSENMTGNTSELISGIAFNPNFDLPQADATITCLYELDINEWAGGRTAQLVIREAWRS